MVLCLKNRHGRHFKFCSSHQQEIKYQSFGSTLGQIFALPSALSSVACSKDMAAKKKNDIQVNKWRVGGKVTVREILRASGRQRFRTFCQRAEVHSSKRIRSFETKAEAEAYDAESTCSRVMPPLANLGDAARNACGNDEETNM